MAVKFTEQQFEEAWRELDGPQMGEEWKFWGKIESFMIYSRFIKKARQSEYKIFGMLSNCPPELCADVYMDLAFRRTWDEYVAELSERDCDGQEVIHWEVMYPSPMQNRDVSFMFSISVPDLRGSALKPPGFKHRLPEEHQIRPVLEYRYVYVRERRDLEVNGRKTWVVLAKSCDVPQCPPQADVVRVKDYKQSIAIRSDGAGGSEVIMNYFENPGKISSWFGNWVSMSLGPDFLKGFQKACVRYAKRPSGMKWSANR